MNVKQKMIAGLCASLVLLGSAAALPQTAVQPDYAVTVSAAEADYDWSGFLKKDASWFAGSEAIKIADECIQYQVANEGGWQKGMTTAHTGDWAHSTIDNDATTSQIRFLMRTYQQTKQQKYLDCAMRGVDCLFKMQYSNGGWMQCLNTPGTYHAHITLNDGAYVHVLQIMKEISSKSGDFTAVSDAYAQKAKTSLENGIQCLLDMQISGAAWCQQHDENTLKPAAARAYELPSNCTSESAGIITFLYQYAKENPARTDIRKSVNTAIEWFKKVTLTGIEFVKSGDDKIVRENPNASPLWARFYELNTDRPLFSDRDSSVHYNVMEISQERRTGYAWYGNWGKNIVSLALLPTDGSQDEPEDLPQMPEYSSKLIAQLVVNDSVNGASWGIEENFGVGSKMFGDRDYTVAGEGNTPASGGELIRTACDSKKFSGDLATLTAAEDLTLSVYMDVRVIQSLSAEQLNASWLKDFTHMRTQLFSSNGEEFTVFVRDVKKGESVTLGSNFTSQNCVNYFAAVFAKPAETTETTTETTTTESTTTTITETTTTTAETATTTTTETVTTTTTAETSAAEKLGAGTGDVNCDGNVDVSDAVLLARFLAEDAGAEVTAQGKINAECDGIDGLSADDNIMILQYIAKIIAGFPDWD